MKIVIYPSENNKINVFMPHENIKIEDAIDRGIPKNVNYIIEDSNFIDYFFIDSYKFENGKISIDHIEAKKLWYNKYRISRTPLLEKLDLEYMRADETGDLELKKEIATKKQALRDVTKTELPDDLAGIKATWPEILGPKPF